MASSYIVTTFASDCAQTKIWNSAHPLALGFPLKWVIEESENVLRVRNLFENNKNSLYEMPLSIPQQSVEINLSQEKNSKSLLRLKIKKLCLKTITLKEKTTFKIQTPNPLTEFHLGEQNYFKKIIKYSFVGLLGVTLLSLFIPKQRILENELIPKPYTKIVFSKSIKQEMQAASSGGNKQTETVPEKKLEKNNAAYVQAFRAKALKNAMSNLLKGGMTKLLAQSDLVMGRNHANASKNFFNSNLDSLKAFAPSTGDRNYKQVQVASLGGAGFGDGGGHGVGYLKGKYAQVSGHGKSFVTIDSGASDIEEGLTKDEVGEVIHKHLSEIRYCYESAMMKTPDLEGKLVIHFQIGGAGGVKTAAVKTSTLPDPRLDDCVLRRLVTWKFPTPKGGIDVAVSYPFIFKTLER